MSELLVIQQECDQATQVVTQRLVGCGLQVVRSFDLRQAGKLPSATAAGKTAAPDTNEQLALTPPAGCHCTHHGAEPCDCQMVIMLVYGPTVAPATLVAHGHDGLTWFTLVDTPEQRPSLELARSIASALQSPAFLPSLESAECCAEDGSVRQHENQAANYPESRPPSWPAASRTKRDENSL